MPTKRKKGSHERQGSDLQDWLELSFGEQLLYKYFGVRGDEPFAEFCFLIFGPNDPGQTNGLRELWAEYREEIIRTRDELAPDLELWARRNSIDETLTARALRDDALSALCRCEVDQGAQQIERGTTRGTRVFRVERLARAHRGFQGTQSSNYRSRGRGKVG